MRPVPYVGITGFTTNSQVRMVLSRSKRRSQIPYFMVGVLVSDKTLRGERAKWHKRNPDRHLLGTIFEPRAHAINLVHFHSANQDLLPAQMLEVDRLAGEYCDGLQLNMTWPSPAIVEAYLARSISRKRKRTIVLQCGMRALEQLAHNPKKIAKRVKVEYEGLVDYVLIDPSGGEGKEFEIDFAYGCLAELFATCRSVGPGVAGGLSVDNVVEKIAPLVGVLPERFAIDVETRVRDQNDVLDIGKCIAFIKKSMTLWTD
jgi:hypothetical protein